MWDSVIRPASLAETLQVLAERGGAARIVAGGTDVLVELLRGVKPTRTLVDISDLRELKYVRRDGATIAIGGRATHNDVLAAPFARGAALPLAQACIEIGAPAAVRNWVGEPSAERCHVPVISTPLRKTWAWPLASG